MTEENVEQLQRAQEELGMEIASLSCNVIDEGQGGNDALDTKFDKIVKRWA